MWMLRQLAAAEKLGGRITNGLLRGIGRAKRCAEVRQVFWQLVWSRDRSCAGPRRTTGWAILLRAIMMCGSKIGREDGQYADVVPSWVVPLLTHSCRPAGGAGWRGEAP